MLAVVQAGGRGTRVASLTRDKIPKPLLPVAGVPILKRQIETLAREGISEFIVITGYLGGAIEEYFGDGAGLGVSIRYHREEIPLGSGGVLPEIADMLCGGPFFFINGDLIFDFYVDRMISFHHEKGAGITLFAHPNTHPDDSDLLIADENDRVTDMSFKNSTRGFWHANLVNAGIALISPGVLRGFSKGKKLNFEHDIVYTLLQGGVPVYAYRSPEYVHDAGTPERIRRTEADILQGAASAKNLRNPQKAVFLDRDGTINYDPGFIHAPEQFELIETAAQAIREINRSGYLALCVTNQPVVARGLCTEDAVREIHNKMETLLGQQGAYLDGIAFCPHHPDKGYPEERPEYKIRCGCRKPGIDMITGFARRYNIDLGQSWIIGDRQTDILCGKNAGLHTALAGGAECAPQPDIRRADILEAVNFILT